ncbi:MAG: hypothetical protein ACOX5J_17610 [Candidatus Hydrogenedentales bacterium]
MRTVAAHLRFGQLYYYYFDGVPRPQLPDARRRRRDEEPGPDEAQLVDGRLAGEFGPVTAMFPFTPRELHEGWVLGEERLITAVSGEFPWPFDRTPKVRLFNRFGLEIPKPQAHVKFRAGTYAVQITLDDWHEIAVVE